MKIGILTLTLHTNYGGILQAYALQTVLERMGHEVMVFNRPFVPLKTRWCEVFKRIIKKSIGKDVVIFKELKYNREASYINQNVWEFRKKYIHERTIESLCEIRENDVDCIVVGSDQVWRPVYFESQWETGIENAYLDFTKGWDLKRVAYAASLGVDQWEQNSTTTETCKYAVKLFDAISVREPSGVSLLKDNFGVEATHVLDPTLLLTSDDYKNLFKVGKTPKSKGNLLVYILDPNKEKSKVVKRIAIEKQLNTFSVNNTLVKESAPLEERKLPSVEAWLRGFYDAEFVITDSFHACVFSILFNKPFAVFANEKRGASRIVSLLKMFGLEKSLLQGNTISGDVDYKPDEETYKKLYAWRNLSLEFLKKAGL